MTFAAVAMAVVATSVAQVLFRLYFLRRRRVLLFATVGLFCTVPVLNYLALRWWSMSTVYMATGLTYVLVMLLANRVLGEPMDRRKLGSMGLIVAGVVVFNA